MNLQSEKGDTALMIALRFGFVNYARVLAPVTMPNIRNARGETAAMLVCGLDLSNVDNFKFLQEFLENREIEWDHQDDSGQTALMRALQQKPFERSVALFLAPGIRHDIRRLLDEDRNNAFMYACRSNQLEYVREALPEEAANLNFRNQDGWTALMLSSNANHLGRRPAAAKATYNRSEYSRERPIRLDSFDVGCKRKAFTNSAHVIVAGRSRRSSIVVHAPDSKQRPSNSTQYSKLVWLDCANDCL